MARMRFWIGSEGPFYYDDAIAAFRFETGSGTISVGPLAGQSASSVNIDGGEIDGTVIGSNSASPATLTTTTVSHFLLQGATSDLTVLDSGTPSATELGWVEVLVGNTTGYIRVYSAK